MEHILAIEMRMSSFQQRTDDLYRLKTRNLIFQNVDGTFPAKGNVAFTKDTVGSLGWSSIVLDNAGGLTVPGNVSLGDGSVTVDTTTRQLSANYGLGVVGGITTDAITSNNVSFISQASSSIISNMYDTNDANGVETLTWVNNSLNIEPISGWSSRIKVAPYIFRTVDTSTLTGTTLILAQNMNALLNILLNQRCFVSSITSSTTFAAVFNTTIAIKFTVIPPAGSLPRLDFTVSQPGNSAAAVTYSALADSINGAYFAAGGSMVNPAIIARFNTVNNLFSINSSAGYTFSYNDVSNNGSGQMFFKHLWIDSWVPSVSTSNILSTVRGDLAVAMPSTPIAAPKQVVGGTFDICCQLVLLPPPASVIPIVKTCIYWCLSGSPFPVYPNAIIDASNTLYTIDGLIPNTTYNVALSYRSVYDESALGPILTFKTAVRLGRYTFSGPTSQAFSVDVTEDPNWLSTPSYGVANVNYNKQYVSGVKFTVATVFAAIYNDTFSDLANINQINEITIDFYTGVIAVGSDVRLFTGSNPNRNILFTPDTTIDPQYGDAYGIGGSMTIYPDADGIDMLYEIFNADDDGVIDMTKNINFGWFCSRGGGLRNCEVTGFSVVYIVA